jgi:hypothetical protein
LASAEFSTKKQTKTKNNSVPERYRNRIFLPPRARFDSKELRPMNTVVSTLTILDDIQRRPKKKNKNENEKTTNKWPLLYSPVSRIQHCTLPVPKEPQSVSRASKVARAPQCNAQAPNANEQQVSRLP